jgi:hypothetical protein
MNTANALTLLQLLIQLGQQTQSYAATLRQAASEGRDVSAAELDEAANQYDAVSAAHRDAIARAKAEGR